MVELELELQLIAWGFVIVCMMCPSGVVGARATQLSMLLLRLGAMLQLVAAAAAGPAAAPPPEQ